MHARTSAKPARAATKPFVARVTSFAYRARVYALSRSLSGLLSLSTFVLTWQCCRFTYFVAKMENVWSCFGTWFLVHHVQSLPFRSCSGKNRNKTNLPYAPRSVPRSATNINKILRILTIAYIILLWYLVWKHCPCCLHSALT